MRKPLAFNSAAIPRNVQRRARKSLIIESTACSCGSGSSWPRFAPSRNPYAMLPTRSPFDRLCCIASRVRSPIASRSHWLTAVMMLITSLPAAEPVSSDSATETSETPRRCRDWGTYVATHVYTSPGIRRALDAGIKSIEHAHLADEATIQLIGEKGAWLSTQPFEPGDEPLSPANKAKISGMVGAWERILGWAKQHNVKVAFGTDLLFQPN